MYSTILIATTSTNLTKPIMSLSVIKTFDNLFWGTTSKLAFIVSKNELLNGLITDNEIIGFVKLVEVVARGCPTKK